MDRRVLLSFLAVAACAGFALVGFAQNPPADAKDLVGHTDPVYAVDFTPDGAQIVTGSFDKTLKLWDAVTKKPVRTFSGHTALLLTVPVSTECTHLSAG